MKMILEQEDESVSQQTRDVRHEEISEREYEKLFSRTERSNLLQSPYYGNAKAESESLKVKRFALNNGTSVVAIYQAILKSLPLLGTFVRINRGPLPVVEMEAMDRILLIRAIYGKWVMDEGNFLLMAPELEQTKENRYCIKDINFREAQADSWKSGWINLEKSEDVLRKNLAPKWRNMLKKSEKQGMDILFVKSSKDFKALILEYDEFMTRKGATGVPPNLLNSLYNNGKSFTIALRAYKANRIAGAVVVSLHADSSTYLIGYSNDEGRRANVNYLLLWEAMILCKQRGIRWFDVGGIDEVKTPGVAHFKKGLGCSPYQLIGEFDGRLGCRNILLSAAKKIRGH